MDPYRTYGAPPYTVVVVHGGPGAPGSVAPVARELSSRWGVLETLHDARSVDGQLEELRAAITEVAQPPVSLVGHSWGAMLGYLFAARHPSLVRKLVMIGSGVFEKRYAAGIDALRESRLSEAEREEVDRLSKVLESGSGDGVGLAFTRLGVLFAHADAYDPLPDEPADFLAQYDVFSSVWPQVEALRASGELLQLGRAIQCPVVAIHGDYDSHPIEGVQVPLAATVRDFRLIVLERCGHEPWHERQAREAFFRILQRELST